MRAPFKEYPINQTVDFVTEVDKMQASPLYALKMRGLLNRKDGIVAQKDPGTIHKYATYPIRPNSFTVITNAVTNGGLIRISSVAHGLVTNDIAYIAEVIGVENANNVYKVTRIDADTVDLIGSTFAGAYTSGGIITKTPINIVDYFILPDALNDTYYDVIVGVDQDGNTRLYVYLSGVWEELTRKCTAAIDDASIGASDTSVVVGSVQERGVNVAIASNELVNWIVLNTTQTEAALITANAVIASGGTGTITTGFNILGSNGLNWATTNTLEFYRLTGIYDGFTFMIRPPPISTRL
jgi:hypothetical protein